MFSLLIFNFLFSPLPAGILFFPVLKITQHNIRQNKKHQNPPNLHLTLVQLRPFFSSFYCYTFKDGTPFSHCTVTSSSTLLTSAVLQPLYLSFKLFTERQSYFPSRKHSGCFSALILLDFCMHLTLSIILFLKLSSLGFHRQTCNFLLIFLL